MKPFLFAALCAVSLTLSCHDATAPAPANESPQAVAIFGSGTLLVHVYFEEGLAGKRVEILERGIVRETNQNGYAKFFLRPGEYTVRAYEINRGGPAMLYVDTPVKIRPHEVTRLEIFDCLPCV